MVSNKLFSYKHFTFNTSLSLLHLYPHQHAESVFLYVYTYWPRSAVSLLWSSVCVYAHVHTCVCSCSLFTWRSWVAALERGFVIILSHGGAVCLPNNGLLSLGGLSPESDVHHQDRFLHYIGAGPMWPSTLQICDFEQMLISGHVRIKIKFQLSR